MVQSAVGEHPMLYCTIFELYCGWGSRLKVYWRWKGKRSITRWAHLYSGVVLDLISLYLFFVYIDVFFVFLRLGVSRCSQRLISVPIHSLCVRKWVGVQHLHAQSYVFHCSVWPKSASGWIPRRESLPLVPRELHKNNHVLLWEYGKKKRKEKKNCRFLNLYLFSVFYFLNRV